MKMVKKCIIALAVVALMVTFAKADDPIIKKDVDQWPWEYKAIDICKFDVLMEVGHYVQLKECHKRELIVQQVSCTDSKEDGGLGKGEGDFPCFTGCEDIQVRANFPAVFGASLGAKHSVIDKSDLYWKDGNNTINGSGSGDAWETLTICLDLWKVKMWQAGVANTKMKIGEITINVKPPDS
jgi:hypothetical protein